MPTAIGWHRRAPAQVCELSEDSGRVRIAKRRRKLRIERLC